MSHQIKHQEFTASLQLKSIELLNGSINLPGVPNVSLSNFNFNIGLESKADAANKLLFVIVSVEIKTEDQNYVLGSLSASCIYSLDNFEELVKIEANGRLDMPKPLVEMLNSISISTTRGLMFSTFKGTFLHNAFLPIIDPTAFEQAEK
ncbi:MAG TPA: hypothetical protein VMR70_15730 [Flavisolibacter sp.]|nr:hypothetical protein [Flavisolibacter sp.]